MIFFKNLKEYFCGCGVLKEQISSLESTIERYKNKNKLTKKIERVPKEDRERLKSWSLRVREVGECDICSETKNLTAHHLWDKKTHPTLRFQEENGVCLCETCHNDFHKKYKSGSQTTPSMYNKFKMGRIGELNVLKARI